MTTLPGAILNQWFLNLIVLHIESCRVMKKVDDDEGAGSAAIVCVHVALEGYPILLAVRDKPTVPEDSGWQFLCNSGQDENEDEAQVWALSEVFEHDPSLFGLLDVPPGTKLVRGRQNQPWGMA
jgi:hypothetical protein